MMANKSDDEREKTVRKAWGSLFAGGRHYCSVGPTSASEQGSEPVATTPIVVHIPHASTDIPAEEREHLLIDDRALESELLAMTDHFADELFDLPLDSLHQVSFPWSRLLVDPERFADDTREETSKHGMGVIYEKTSQGQKLRESISSEERDRLLNWYYYPHHELLAHMVDSLLRLHDRCLIIDGHTFPSNPLPCDLDQRPRRPDICIGTDSFHTPETLEHAALKIFSRHGWIVERNRPYAGAIVPPEYHRTDQKVSSMMIEINRRLYMDEETGEKTEDFELFKNRMQDCLLETLRASGWVY